MPDSESFVRDQAVAAIGPFAGAISFQTNGAPDDLEDQLSGVLTLEHAIREALGSSPAIQVALSRVRIAAADARQARLLPNPVVSVALRFPEGGGQPIIEAGLVAELLSLLQQPGRISAADHRLRAASWQALATILDLLTEVQERYVQTQALDAHLPWLQEQQQLLTRTIEHAEARLKAGEGTRLDLTTLQAQRVSIEARLSAAVTLDGGDGNDTLTGGTGNDCLLGGSGDGDDLLAPGPGKKKKIIKSSGNDTVI